MDQIWFILIKGKQEGPLSLDQLKQDKRITPDTYVWREGFSEWLPIRQVVELKILFLDPPKKRGKKEEKQEEEKEEIKLNLVGQEELTLDFKRDLPPILFWLVVTLLVLIFFFNKAFFDK